MRTDYDTDQQKSVRPVAVRPRVSDRSLSLAECCFKLEAKALSICNSEIRMEIN